MCLVEAVKSHSSAVFHLHGGWIPVFSRLCGVFVKLGIKYVITPHGAYNEVAMKKSS